MSQEDGLEPPEPPRSLALDIHLANGEAGVLIETKKGKGVRRELTPVPALYMVAWSEGFVPWSSLDSM